MDDEYVLRSSVLNAIHNGDIDMGMVTPQEYHLLQELSRRIDQRIQSIPAADVAPVVRCVECENSDICFDHLICEQWGVRVREDDFCSRGVK